MPDADFLARGRAYAARTPDDTAHARVLALLDPSWTPPGRRPAVPLTAAARPGRNRGKDSAPSTSTRRTSSTAAAAPKRPATVDEHQADEHHRTPPPPPPGARRLWVRGYRWARVAHGVPGARQWERLACDLVVAGPFTSLDVRRGDPGADHDAVTRFHTSDDDTEHWAEIVVAARIPAPDAERALRHELGHVADETGRLTAAATPASWRASFTSSFLADRRETFAEDVAEWLTPTTTAADLLDAARRYREGRPPRAE